MHRLTLGKMQNPVRGFLHGSAALASVVGLVVLLAANPGGLSLTVALAIYAASLVLMFTVSSLYHSIPWSSRSKLWMQRLDHSMIFLVVAGTYTPIAVVSLEGAWQSATLAAVWAGAVVGIVLKFALRSVAMGISITIYQLMGWSAAIPMWQIGRRLGVDAVALIGLGGLLYTVGMVFMLTGRPRLFPRVFSSHEVFHVLVVAASATHFAVIMRDVLPAAVG